MQPPDNSFSEQRFAASVRACDVFDCVPGELLVFPGGAPRSDDITMLSLRLNR